MSFSVSSGSDDSPSTSFVPVVGSRLYYQQSGTGAETVVLVHDGLVNSVVWDDLWPAFCRHFHAIRYDRRGYGRSPSTTDWYAETEDLAALLRHVGVTHATLVGSSHGGEISINFALDFPELVRRLVLVGAVVGGFPYSAHFQSRIWNNFELIRKGDIPGGLRVWANDKYLIAPGNDAARKKLLGLLLANPQDLTHADQILTPKPAWPV